MAKAVVTEIFISLSAFIRKYKRLAINNNQEKTSKVWSREKRKKDIKVKKTMLQKWRLLKLKEYYVEYFTFENRNLNFPGKLSKLT